MVTQMLYGENFTILRRFGNWCKIKLHTDNYVGFIIGKKFAKPSKPTHKVSVLEKFINFNQTKNEVENRLEQLRALDNNITIMVALAKSSPIGIDTKEDYLALKKIMEYKS